MSPDTGSSLINRNLWTDDGRTSIRLEPEFWEGLEEIAKARGRSLSDLVRYIDARGYVGTRTSAVRTFILCYFRAKAGKKRQ